METMRNEISKISDHFQLSTFCAHLAQSFLFSFLPLAYETDKKNQQQIKEYLANPEAFAAAAVTPAAAADSGAGGGSAPAAAAAEPEEESDDDMVSADLPAPHPHIPPTSGLAADSFCVPRAVDPVLHAKLPPTAPPQKETFTDEPFFILFNFPPSFSMGPTGTLFLDSFHRVSISSAEQTSVPYLIWSQVSTIVVAVLLLYLSIHALPGRARKKYRHLCDFRSPTWHHATW